MSQAPIQPLGILVADPLEDAVLLFLDAALEPVRSQHRDHGERENQRADQREGHGVGHGMEELSGRTGQRVDGKITGDDDGDGIKDGAVHVAGRREDHFLQLVFWP